LYPMARLRIAVILVAVILAFVLAAIGCTAIREPECTRGTERSVNEVMYFGTAMPNGVVTSDDWAQFLSTSVTPRFPEGLTVWQASGQWKAADGAVVREPSFVLNLLHPDDERSERAVRAIAAEYKSRFSQDAVLRVKSHACISF
jgi:hypothetical protein